MIKEAKLFVALALVAAFITCHAAAVDESKDEGLAENRPVIEVKVDDHLFKVPVYEDTKFTAEKIKLDVKQFRTIKARLLEVAEMVLIKENDYYYVGKKAWGIIELFREFTKVSRELSATDASPPISEKFGPEMSELVQVILDTKTDVFLSGQDCYERVKISLEGVEKLIRASPVGSYLNWKSLTIDGVLLPAYIAPVMQWLRRESYSMILKIVGLLGGMFKNLGNKNVQTVTELIPEETTPEV